ncbi:aspartate aminotransferase [Stylonychia lemnae]|uniref:Aspartate aminotransferase n=1 Tax=Stylonychia lemnae TaxID=5949 RepID=A0A078A8V1_STYLE|nr:aspartate aminotransferase [Stylonychia lemnae]|eukprot:CDW78700.1 aspartate aminotransferase [Stylonychia lemnae]
MLSNIIAKNFKSAAQFNKVACSTFSTWSTLEAAPPDPILGLNEVFKKDPNPKKVLLGMGVYRDNENKPYILNCIRKAEQIIIDRKMDHEYAGIQGIDSFIANALKLAYGADSQLLKDGRVAGAQSISGTGSIRLGFDFLSQFYPNKQAEVLVPNPTWPVHRTIPGKVGMKAVQYRYYDPKTRGLDFQGLQEDLDKAKNDSIVLFHVCAHNPTGVDPTPAQWKDILEVVKRKNHFVCFDSAYQGFASGDLQKDAYSLNLFTSEYDRIMLFQSFAKNFGIYGQRAGCLSLVTGSKKETEVVMSRVKELARAFYSNPPIHGARLVDIVLSDPALTNEWHSELKVMSGRMATMRTGLVENLKARGSQHSWRHITDQIGMFAYTGLTKEMVDELRAKYSIYMSGEGRISICGLNTHNLEYISDAFHAVTKDKQI